MLRWGSCTLVGSCSFHRECRHRKLVHILAAGLVISSKGENSDAMPNMALGECELPQSQTSVARDQCRARLLLEVSRALVLGLVRRLYSFRARVLAAVVKQASAAARRPASRSLSGARYPSGHWFGACQAHEVWLRKSGAQCDGVDPSFG